MRSIFEMGWTPAEAHWSGAVLALGQNGGATFMQEDRDKLINTIMVAMNKVPILDDLFVYSGDYDPGLKRAFGLDSSRFSALSNSIAPLFPKVKDVLMRMSDPDPEFWVVPSAEEDAAVKQWTTGVNEMHRIYVAHKDLPLQLPPGVPAPPGFTRASVAPAAKHLPGQPGIVTPVVPVAPAGGLGTNELLLGGGLAVGLGLLIYAVVS